METNNVVGVDIGKHWLDVWISPSGEYRRLSNTAEGRISLVDWLLGIQPSCVALEASGVYEQLVTQILAEAGLPVSRLNPRQVRDFAKATGQLAKTDRMDAKILAAFAQTLKPASTVIAGKERQELGALVGRRRQLVDMASEEKTRLKSTLDAAMASSIKSHIAWLVQEITVLETSILKYVKQNPVLSAPYQQLLAVKGIGAVTAAVLLAELPELGRLDHNKIVSLVGLAPHNVDSGLLRGQRHIRGGRKDVRCVLYMAALSALHSHDRLTAFYKRLRFNGKPAKVAIVAVMRKLLVYLNAILRDFYAESENHSQLV